MAAKGILTPTLKIIIKTHYPRLPAKQQSPSSSPSDIPPSPSPLLSAEPESLGDNQIESEKYSLETRAAMVWRGNTVQRSPRRVIRISKGEIRLAYRRRWRARWSLGGERLNPHELVGGGSTRTTASLEKGDATDNHRSLLASRCPRLEGHNFLSLSRCRDRTR